MEYSQDFMNFWHKYPGRYHEAGRRKANGEYEHYWKVGKRQAFLEWKKLTETERKWALYAVQYMTKGRYVPDPHRWLKNGRFEDFDPPREESFLTEQQAEKILKVVKFDDRSVSDRVNEQRKKLNEIA